jgi:AmmeMemoRadiSam system protein B
LAQAVDVYLASVAPGDAGPCPLAIVAPHAGLMYSGPVAASAYALLRRCRYSAVALVGPSHFVGFRGVSIWPRGTWQTPYGNVDVAEDVAAAIAAESHEIREHPAAHEREDSLEMQPPFAARLLSGVPIVPLVMGHQPRGTAFGRGDAIARALRGAPRGAADSRWSDGRDALLVASSDLSHYEDAATASRMDAVVLARGEAFDADGLMETLEREPRHAYGGGHGGHGGHGVGPVGRRAVRRDPYPGVATRRFWRRIGRGVLGGWAHGCSNFVITNSQLLVRASTRCRGGRSPRGGGRQ